MKRTIIKYKEIGNSVEVLSIKNVSSMSDIKKVSPLVYNEYTNEKGPFYLALNGSNLSIDLYYNKPNSTAMSIVQVTVGNIYSIHDFYNVIIRNLKYAGDRYRELVKHYNQAEVQVIAI